ncbi:MAG TPA: hypothetical protein PLB45_04630 [Bacilli bacterium]|nr:hypothetical protein [Bacilli bacterium]
MKTECIYSVDITTNKNDMISLPSHCFSHLYIANVDDNGDEVEYELGNKDDNLYANYFMIKILNDNNVKTYENMDRMLKKKDIVSVNIHFTNGRSQIFDLAKNRVRDNGVLVNKYEEAFKDEDNLCIVVSDKKIRYVKELFA